MSLLNILSSLLWRSIADDIHDAAVVSAAVVISGFNSIPASAVIHTVLAVLSSL